MKNWIALFLSGLYHNSAKILLMSVIFLTSAAITSLIIRHYDRAAFTPVNSQVETGAPPALGSIPDGLRETIAQENWQFTVPGAGWEKVEPANEGIKVVLKNELTKKLVLFVKEPTAETYDRYVVGNMKTVSQAGAPILGASNLTMHDEKFAVILAGQGNIWIWITVKDGFGYVLTCGGAVAADVPTQSALDNMCVFIAKSLQIK
jgi:hypothetical protein